MKQTITENEFCQWFAKHRPNNFSLEGRIALFEYLTELEEDCGDELDFEPIALCCDYSEYESAIEACEDYSAVDVGMEEDDCLKWLEANTMVWPFDGGIIIQNF